MTLVKTDEKSFVRDTKNMALLETDLMVKNEYIHKKKLLIENRNLKTKMEKMEKDIETLKNLLMGSK